MFRGHTSEWKSVSRGRARNSACNLTVFEGKYHCKYMNNNAFAQARHPFFSLPVQQKARRCDLHRRGGKQATPLPLSPPLGSAAEAAGGGAPASSGGTSPRSPLDEGETLRGRSKATGGSPVRDAAARRVGGSVARESPQSSTRRRSGGGRRWSTRIRRWKVSTLSARRRTPAARPTSTQPEESAGRLPGWIKIPSRPGTCIRRGNRAPQAADHRRGERAKRGETTSRRRAYSPAGMAGCAPEAGGSSVAMGDCPLSAGKNSTPSVPPGRWAVRRKRINVDIWKKLT